MAKKAKHRKKAANPLSTRIRSDDAPWIDGPVPAGFWQYPQNRRNYLLWLGQQLGFKKLDDYYKIKTEHFKQNRGSGALLHCWNSSAVTAVLETFPEHDWKEWLFVSCPRSFWKSRKNHRRYMDWLAGQCKIKAPEDWYRITNEDFRNNKGGAFLLQYNSKISDVVKKYLPKFKLLEWKFAKTPKGFWKKRENRLRYMKWLAKELGITKPTDWYAVPRDAFEKNHGNQFIKHYDGSPMAAVIDCFPNRKWEEWRFARVPAGFWRKKANRQRFLTWFEKRMKIRKPADWRKIRRLDLKQNFGGGLLAMYKSIEDLLKGAGRKLPKPPAKPKKKTAKPSSARRKAASKKRKSQRKSKAK